MGLATAANSAPNPTDWRSARSASPSAILHTPTSPSSKPTWRPIKGCTQAVAPSHAAARYGCPRANASTASSTGVQAMDSGTSVREMMALLPGVHATVATVASTASTAAATRAGGVSGEARAGARPGAGASSVSASRDAAQLTPSHDATVSANTATGGGSTTHAARSSPKKTNRTLNASSSPSR